MKALLVIPILAIMQARALAGIETDIASTNRYIETKIEATNQSIPEPRSWVPTPADVPRALKSIQSFLDQPHTTNASTLAYIRDILPNSKNYHVQFAGVNHHGRNLVCCSFVVYGSDPNRCCFPTVERPTDRPIYLNWEIYYDPATDQCSGFASNGYN